MFFINKHILIIEDDSDIRESIKILLSGEGFIIEEAVNGEEGLQKFSNKINLIILDIMMPGKSGLEICKEIRQTSYVPILFLTAKSKEEDKLIGFNAGADDYLVKPFSHTELFARVKALLRRHQIYDNNDQPEEEKELWVENHNIRINTENNRVYLNGAEINLTQIEYKMLLIFMQHPDKTFSVQDLYENIWDEEFLTTSSNTIMVHIRNLRIKIEENPQKPKIILTVWGKGYRLG